MLSQVSASIFERREELRKEGEGSVELELTSPSFSRPLPVEPLSFYGSSQLIAFLSAQHPY